MNTETIIDLYASDQAHDSLVKVARALRRVQSEARQRRLSLTSRAR